MSKLTREEFHVLRTRAEHDLAQSREVPSILICAGTGCIAGGAMKIYDNFRSECEARGLKVYVGLKHDSDEEKSLHVKMSGCHGFCEMGPLVHIEPMGVMYIHVKPEDCHEILEKTVLGGEVIDRLVYHLDGTAYPMGGDMILHIPLGSDHGVKVDGNRHLHYMWIDVMPDQAKGLERLNRTHKPTGLNRSFSADGKEN